ncbi:MAG TPA: flippase [Acidimicrobiales bacterium]|nr:flippase [Acidimicrobiales bacterium]
MRSTVIQGTDPTLSRREIIGVAKGAGFLASGSVIEVASRFVIAFVLARSLTADDFGLYNLAISASAIIVGLASLGLDDAMVRYVAIQSDRRDEDGIAGTLQVGFAVSMASSIVLGLVVFLAADWISEAVFNEAALSPLLRFFVIMVPLLTLSRTMLGAARGFGRMDYAAICENVIQSVVKTGLLALLLIRDIDLWAAVIIFAIGDLSSSVAMTYLLNKQYSLTRSLSRTARRESRELMGFALPLWLSGILNQFRRNVETLMLGALTAVSNVGIYAVVTRVNMISHIAYRAIIVSVKPALARLHGRGDRLGLSNVYAATTRWAITLNMPFFLFMVLYPTAILNVFGKRFTSASTALVILAVSELIVAATGVCGSMIDMARHVRVKMFNSVAWITVQIGASALLIPRWKVLGAAIAALVATSFVNLLRMAEVWYLDRLVPFGRDFWKPFVAGGAAYALGMLLRHVVPPHDAIGPSLLQGAIVSTTFLALTVALRIAPDDREILHRIFRRLPARVGRLLGLQPDKSPVDP